MKQGVDSENPTGLTTLEWVDWFNNRRLLEPIGNIPPAEAEQRYYAMLEQPAMAA
jgi:putative transposase